MTKKVLMMILLLGVISVSGCHTAQRTSVRAGYPYGPVYVDRYPRYYRDPFFYPYYFYDPYPYFFFRSDFFFYDPYPIVPHHGFSQPRRNLRGGSSGSFGRGFSNPSPGSTSPGPAPAPAPPPQRNLR